MTTPIPQPEAPTPETDDHEEQLYDIEGDCVWAVEADFARTLERQRNAARKEASRAWGCEQSKTVVVAMMQGNQETLIQERDAARAELANVTKEREAITAALWRLHNALDGHKNGDVLHWDIFRYDVEEILGKPWVQGATLINDPKLRAAYVELKKLRNPDATTSHL